MPRHVHSLLKPKIEGWDNSIKTLVGWFYLSRSRHLFVYCGQVSWKKIFSPEQFFSGFRHQLSGATLSTKHNTAALFNGSTVFKALDRANTGSRPRPECPRVFLSLSIRASEAGNVVAVVRTINLSRVDVDVGRHFSSIRCAAVALTATTGNLAPGWSVRCGN